MDLPTMRARVRRDLHDEDSDNYRWTDDELDRHIQRALNEVSTASPHELKAVLTASAGSRELSLSSLSGLLSVQAVEYPVGAVSAQLRAIQRLGGYADAARPGSARRGRDRGPLLQRLSRPGRGVFHAARQPGRGGGERRRGLRRHRAVELRHQPQQRGRRRGLVAVLDLGTGPHGGVCASPG